MQLSGYDVRDRECCRVPYWCAGGIEFPHLQRDGGGFSRCPRRGGTNGRDRQARYLGRTSGQVRAARCGIQYCRPRHAAGPQQLPSPAAASTGLGAGLAGLGPGLRVRPRGGLCRREKDGWGEARRKGCSRQRCVWSLGVRRAPRQTDSGAGPCCNRRRHGSLGQPDGGVDAGWRSEWSPATGAFGAACESWCRTSRYYRR